MEVALGILRIPNVSLWETATKISGTDLKSFGAGFADSTLKTEKELLFTIAGKLHVITWYCTNVFIFEKIWATGMTSIAWFEKKNTRTFLCYIILI